MVAEGGSARSRGPRACVRVIGCALLLVFGVPLEGCAGLGSTLRTTGRSLGFVRWFPPHTATSVDGSESTNAKATDAHPDVPPVIATKESPVTVVVHQAFFVGQRLVVKARLTARTELRASEVLVGIQGVKEGQVLTRSFQPLSAVVSGETLGAEKSVLVTLELPAEAITEYQLVCSWGDDARQLRAELLRTAPQALVRAEGAGSAEGTSPVSNGSAEVPPAGAEASAQAARAALAEPQADRSRPEPLGQGFPEQRLSEEGLPEEGLPGKGKAERSPENPAQPLALADLTEVELEQSETRCPTPPCDLRYTIRARLQNTTDVPIRGATFAVGVVWSTGNTLPKTPSSFEPLTGNESTVNLPDLTLDPRGGKRLKIAVDRSIPQVPGGRFYPYVRIVSVNQER